MVKVKLITRTYSYSPVTDEVMLEDIEVKFVNCGAVEALDLVAETNAVVCEDDNYKLFKSGYRTLTTSHAVIC